VAAVPGGLAEALLAPPPSPKAGGVPGIPAR